MKKYIISGGLGFLGSNLVEKLLKKNKIKIYIIDNLSRKGSINNFKKFIKYKNVFIYKVDISKKNHIVKNIIKALKPDYFFHLAGQVSMNKSINNPLEDLKINTLGTLNILESIKKYSRNTFLIFSSTNKVYGDLNYIKYKEKLTRYKPYNFSSFSEKIPLSFSTPYGCSKGAADQYVIDYSRCYKLNFVVFRHSTIYGPKQFFDINQGWVSWFCKKIIEQKFNKTKKFSVTGNGKQVRDILYIDDAVDLYLKAIKFKKKISGEAFNIGGGSTNSISIIELLNIVGKKIKFKPNYFFINQRLSDQKYFVCNLSKIYNFISWFPKIEKLKGIGNVIESILQYEKK